jgi:formylglycine-generating enzyme required for sulfatase activity
VGGSGTGASGQGGSGQGGGGGEAPTGCDEPVTGMIEIPAGPFQMGCNSGVDTQCRSDESPRHEVFLDCYLIDRYEVSRGDYKACIDASVCSTPADDWDPVALSDHPVTFVTWEMANTYCQWAGKRLPTEAEWEKAARGTDSLLYPFGNIWGGGTPSTGNCSQMNGNLCLLDTWKVTDGATGTSPYGLFNMGGNVEEWVSDWYGSAYYASSPPENPQGPASGGAKVKRGGSWDSAVFDLRTGSRRAGVPDSFPDLTDGPKVGFRCAR